MSIWPKGRANNALDRTAMSAVSDIFAEACALAALMVVGQLGLGRKMKIVTPLLFLLMIVFCSCGRKEDNPVPDFQMRTDTGKEVPPEMKRQFAEAARLQAEGLVGATTIVHSAYNYSGFSQIKPVPGGKLVAVDVEFRGYSAGFDPDDVEILDGSSETNYGSDPDIAYLTADGKFKSYDYTAPGPGEALRYLFVYAVPSKTASVKLGYWTKIITPQSVALRDDGLALPVRESKTKEPNKWLETNRR